MYNPDSIYNHVFGNESLDFFVKYRHGDVFRFIEELHDEAKSSGFAYEELPPYEYCIAGLKGELGNLLCISESLEGIYNADMIESIGGWLEIMIFRLGSSLYSPDSKIDFDELAEIVYSTLVNVGLIGTTDRSMFKEVRVSFIYQILLAGYKSMMCVDSFGYAILLSGR